MKISEWLKVQKQDLVKRVKNYSKARALFFVSLILGLLLSLFSLWEKIFNPSFNKIDGFLVENLKGASYPFLKELFNFITFFGSELFIMSVSLVLVVILIQKRRRRAATVSLLSLVGNAFLVSFFKSFFARQRPGECPNSFFGGDFSCFSFPSGHSTFALYFYGLIVYLSLRFEIFSLRKKWLIIAGAVFLIILIAFSRLYLGVHFLSDVIGGFLLGGAWLVAAIFLIDFLY
jgi:membrane-associated phospholipid phosphatase